MKGVYLTLMLSGSAVLAQPAEWVPTPTNAAGTMLATVTVGGEAAGAGDWVAAFDEDGTCAGAVEVVINDGASYISLPIYGDDATTPDEDEGMGSGEAFTLQLWRSATGEILFHPDPEEPAALGGWRATTGEPMPGYDDPYAVYDFAYDGPVLTLGCPPAELCPDGSVYNLSASPDNGGWEGPGVFAVFAGYLFDPALAGYGTHTLTYTTADGLTAECSVTVAETLTPTLDLPLGWCEGANPLGLNGLGTPAGGTWTGDGVLNTPSGAVFDAGVLTPGTVELTYTVEGNCGGAATAPISVYPSPEPPTLTALQGLLYAGNIAEGDSLAWFIVSGYGGQLSNINYSDSIFYFPSWGDIFYVQAINAYGCTALSNPLEVDGTIGVGDIETAPLRIWLDAQGQLQSSTILTDVRWYDLRGRALEGPIGHGPWLVHAVTEDGRNVRRIFAGR